MQEPDLIRKLEWAGMVSADREGALVSALQEIRLASMWGTNHLAASAAKDATLAKVQEELEEAQGQLKKLKVQCEVSAASAALALEELQEKSTVTAASTAQARLVASESELKALNKQVEKLTQDLDASKGQVNRLREEQAVAKAKDANAKEAKADSKEAAMAKELAAAQAEAAAARAAQREAEAAAQAARRRRQEIENTLAAERKALAERERSLREAPAPEEGSSWPASPSQDPCSSKDKGGKSPGRVEAQAPRKRADPIAKQADLEAKALAGTAGPKSKGSRAATREVNRSAAVGKLSHLKRSMGQVRILTWAFGAAIFVQVCLVVSWYTP